MSLVDQSMIPFQRAYPMIFVMVILILAGNTAFVSTFLLIYQSRSDRTCPLADLVSPAKTCLYTTEHLFVAVSLRFTM